MTVRLRATLALLAALPALSACNREADTPEGRLDAQDIPENQGMGGANDAAPSAAASGAGVTAPVNAQPEDRSAADGTTPVQPGQQ